MLLAALLLCPAYGMGQQPDCSKPDGICPASASAKAEVKPSSEPPPANLFQTWQNANGRWCVTVSDGWSHCQGDAPEPIDIPAQVRPGLEWMALRYCQDKRRYLIGPNGLGEYICHLASSGP